MRRVSSPWLARQRALDILGSRVVALDQIAVVGVHDAHERRKVGSGARVERLSERRGCCRQLGDNVSDSLAGLLQSGGLDALTDSTRDMLADLLAIQFVEDNIEIAESASYPADPLADPSGELGRSFDHLVGEREQLGRHNEASALAVARLMDQLEPGRLVDRAGRRASRL